MSQCKVKVKNKNQENVLENDPSSTFSQFESFENLNNYL